MLDQQDKKQQNKPTHWPGYTWIIKAVAGQVGHRWS